MVVRGRRWKEEVGRAHESETRGGCVSSEPGACCCCSATRRVKIAVRRMFACEMNDGHCARGKRGWKDMVVCVCGYYSAADSADLWDPTHRVLHGRAHREKRPVCNGYEGAGRAQSDHAHGRPIGDHHPGIWNHGRPVGCMPSELTTTEWNVSSGHPPQPSPQYPPPSPCRTMHPRKWFWASGGSRETARGATSLL